jgi:RND family efflux transporter MFP subunit
MKKIAIIAIVVFLGLIIGSQILTNAQSKNSKPSYDTSKVQKGTVQEIVSASGKIKSNTILPLQFQTAGFLTYVGAKPGDEVKKGQLIASLDQGQLQKSLQKQLNDYMTNRWNFDQDQKITYQDQALSDTIKRALDKNQFSLNNSVLNVEIADIALKYSNLFSPINGIITDESTSHAGVNITPLSTFTVADYNDIAFSIDVDETDISKVQIGQLVNIKLDAYDGKSFPGVISKIGFSSTTTSSGNTAFPVEIKFPDNSSLRFKIGMNGDAEIITHEVKNTLFVPTEYVFDDDAGRYINVLDSKNNLQKAYIKTGIESETKTEILSGANINQIIVKNKN